MSNSESKTESNNRSHVLIREARSLSNFNNLQDPEAVESKIARGRGGGKYLEQKSKNKTQSEEDQEKEDESDDSQYLKTDGYKFKLNEGKIETQSGYVMHFVPPHYTHLTPYDIVSIPDNTAYPVKQKTADSLPKWVLGQIHQNGHIQITATYDKETKQFSEIQQGWGADRNPYDEIMRLTDELDGDIISAVYYLVNNNASEEYAHPNTIADIRDIQEDSVKGSIRKVENKLTESR